MIIAFDVDDTLIVPAVATGLPIDTPNYENIAMYRWFQSQWHTMVVWSWGWTDYAKHWADKLWLEPHYIWEKQDRWEAWRPDICFDDCDVDLAKVNLKVKRLNNRISRKEWNNLQHNTIRLWNIKKYYHLLKGWNKYIYEMIKKYMMLKLNRKKNN